MTSNLKALGLALVAVSAMSATWVSAAQATEGVFEWETGATELTATSEIAGHGHLFKMTGSRSFECDNVRMTVNLPAGTRATAFETNSSTYNDIVLGEDQCTGVLGIKQKITMNGCQYRFHAGESLKEGETRGTVDIVCPAGKEITTDSALCTINIPPQRGLSHVTYRTIEEEGKKEDITIELAVSNIKYKHTGFCGNGGGANGSYIGNLTVVGENGGKPKHVTVT